MGTLRVKRFSSVKLTVFFGLQSDLPVFVVIQRLYNAALHNLNPSILPFTVLEIVLPSNSLVLKGRILESEKIFIGLANMSVGGEKVLAKVCTASISQTSRGEGECLQ